MTKTYTTYLAIRIAVEADSPNEAEDAAEDIRTLIECHLPTGALTQGWLDTFRLNTVDEAGPIFTD